MTASTARFLALHFMASGLCFGCLIVADPDSERAVYYLPAAVLAVVAFGTLRDFVRYFMADLSRHG